jgi:hypothetical protein
VATRTRLELSLEFSIRGTEIVARKRRSLVTLGALICVAASALFPISASAAEKSFLSSFGPDGTGSSEFPGRARSVAVDQQTQTIYVLAGEAGAEAGTLFRFDAEGATLPWTGAASYLSGNELGGLTLRYGANENQIAVNSDTHGIYVTSGNAVRAFQESGEPAEFTVGPGAGTNEIAGFTELVGVAVDLSGNIYASDYGPGGAGVISVYSPDGEELTRFEAPEPTNLSVAPNGDVYVARYVSVSGEYAVLRYVPSSPVLAGATYSQDGGFSSFSSVPSLAVDPATGDVYILELFPFPEGNLPVVSRYDSTGALIERFPEPGEPGTLTEPAGIAVDSSNGRVYVSDATQVKVFGPPQFSPAPPTIAFSGVKDVSADSAVLRAVINPNSVATSYHFEYGTSDCSAIPNPCTGVPISGAAIGSGHDLVVVSQSIGDLQPNTIYHYRVVAENSLGATASADRTFTTQGVGLGFELSDSRVWEMVSPPHKFGGVLRSSSAGVIQAAEDGNGLVYQSLGSIEAAPEGNRAVEPASVLAWRSADGGWHSEDITPPHTKATTVASGTEYDLFSPDLRRAVLEPRDATPLSPRSSERTPYLRENSEPAVYTPLVTSKEGFANVPPGTLFGGTLEVSDVTVSGANRALSHIVLASRTPLVAGAAPGSLYEWAGGQLQPVSELPDSGAVVQGVLGSEQGSVRHAVSEDGSRVFWSTGSIGTGSIDLTGLYLRDTVAEETTRLDVLQPGASGAGDARPMFQGASADGTVVFFTDSRQLTSDASTSGRDLYRCEIPSGAGSQGCASLTNLSASRASAGESAEVQGLVPAFSEDGTRLYFVALGVLDAAPNPVGEEAIPGEPNLYLWQEGEGSSFVATLSRGDDRDWGKVDGATPGYARTLSAASSPSGRYFSFMSERSLTGYENRDAASGELDEEVYVYDIVTERLACVSCNPTGANPAGQQGPPFGADPQTLWAGRWIAATLPELTVSMGTQLSRYPGYRPRAVLDNGRVFFNSIDSLVSADSNGNWDVYQYEPTGVGSCSISSSDFATSRSGDACVSLISSGTAEGPSTFLDASATGDDVFFLTAGRLSVNDTDTVYDIYDARVNGIAAVLHPVSECAGEACQPAVVPPQSSTPASAVFRSPGNAKHCPKGKRKVRRHGKVRCVRRHKHRKHHKHSHHRKQASKNGGAR